MVVLVLAAVAGCGVSRPESPARPSAVTPVTTSSKAVIVPHDLRVCGRIADCQLQSFPSRLSPSIACDPDWAELSTAITRVIAGVDQFLTENGTRPTFTGLNVSGFRVR
jgi:hypothetical protein